MTGAEDLGRGLGGAPRSGGPSGAAATSAGISGSILERLSGELEGLVAKTSPAVVAVAQQRGQGSGVILTPDGYVLTNRHVVRGGRKELRLGLSSGDELRGELVGDDERSDLAVVRVHDRASLTSLPLAGRDDVRVGQLVVAIGNPLSFERSVSLGVVSALDRTLSAGRGHALEGLIQTDAAINPGNSGGPLVDASGRIVGINTAIIPYAQGIGFAIPAHTASWVAAVLIQRGEIRRPQLGIAARGVELGVEDAEHAGQRRAVRVLGVGSGTPAEQGGVRQGDLLLGVNGAKVATVDDVQRILVLARAPSASLELLRGRARRSVEVAPSLAEAA
ncbi:trypsin-like peptidase domain-containing protein [Myxococcota bacterium]|nr:trypsin-like peptidase domain-containing protein [Myxococcota bacterium]